MTVMKGSVRGTTNRADTLSFWSLTGVSRGRLGADAGAFGGSVGGQGVFVPTRRVQSRRPTSRAANFMVQ